MEQPFLLDDIKHPKLTIYKPPHSDYYCVQDVPTVPNVEPFTLAAFTSLDDVFKYIRDNIM